MTTLPTLLTLLTTAALLPTLTLANPTPPLVSTTHNDTHTTNPALLITPTDNGWWDIYLNITTLPLLPGLKTWDDLAFTYLSEPDFSEFEDGRTVSVEMWEKLAVLDVASGGRCVWTEGCMDDVEGYYKKLVAEEEELERKGGWGWDAEDL